MKFLNQELLKKSAALLLAGTILLGAAACGSKEDEPAPSSDENTVPVASAALPSVAYTSKKVNYEDLLKEIKEAEKINEYANGYLYIPNTNIQMPVVNDNNVDNEYYIDRKLNGEIANANAKNPVDTVVYTESRTILEKDIFDSSSNYVLFGHNWNNIRPPYVIGNKEPDKYTMFAELPSFTDQTFAENNPYLYYATEDHMMIFKVFAVLYSEDDWYAEGDGLKFNYIDPNLSSSQKSSFYNECLDRSMWVYQDVPVASTDIFLTLSTCTREYDAGGEQRFLVVGRMLREGETDEADTTTVLQNVNYKEPTF